MQIRTAIALSLLWVLSVNAQPDSEFEEWQKKEQAAFQQFQEARDREFAEFLQKEWREWQAFQGIPQDTVPKPHVIPVAPIPVPAPAPPAEEPIVQEEPLPEIPPPPPPEQPPAPAPPEIPTAEEKRSADFTFFGMTLTVRYDENLAPPVNGPVNKEGISDFWEAVSRADYPSFLEQARRYRKQLQLNDWGYYQLLDDMAGALCQGAENQRTLLVWFMLSKSGYKVKVGYDDGHVYLLSTIGTTLYSIPYFTLENEKFYSVSATGRAVPIGSVFTYEGSYPGADQPLDIRLVTPPLLGDQGITKNLTFKYRDREQQIIVPLNKNAVDYLGTYPQTAFEVYFAASPSAETGRALLSALKPLVVGQTEREAINLLLHFVQTAFDYQTDDEQFGREKPLFPEETLFYPYSDCEDRSFLFAYLARELLGLNVVGLSYPGHLATAVQFSREVEGDYVEYENARYTVCDPTYINAEVGMAMPQFKGVTPGIIPGHL